MWIFCPTHFLSIVAARDLDAPGHPIDPTRLVVRARRREHLEALIQSHPDLLCALAIMATPTRDYAFRIVVMKEAFAEVMRRQVMGIDYDNFKSAAAAANGHASPYVEALHRVWTVMRGTQK